MHTLFISDLHLCNERPEKLTLFKKLLRGPARKADALYILGDLFEAWAGDDDDTPPHPEIISELAEYTAAGARLYIMRGNRDYLLGQDFAAKTGGHLIDDPAIIKLGGKKTLLMHGDTLCTGDVKYQIYRRIVNNAITIKLFLAMPFSLRAKIWHGIRNLTRKTTQNKSPYIMDVHQPAVAKAMLRNGVFDLIHGHTHKQAIHEFALNGQTARRFVLGDWYERDCVLVADNRGLRLLGVQDYLNSDW
ncbi:MAG: UDP-2,3-diacylglucosamine diphosphatase [Gammaproteobacteria bacterium]|nr:UDP-2,3-diacylglucosamine diphosphatase [Gammaproteobacteria bacterium]